MLTGNARESEGMPVNLALGHVSNDFLIAALVIYSLSVVAFAGDFAYGRPRRAAQGQQVGGLARMDASGGFEEEFASLAAELRSAHDRAAQSQQEGE